MASVQTSKYDGRYLKLTVVEESTSIENNTSTVRWTLESIGGNSNYYNVYSVEVKINNVTVYGPTTKTWDSKVFPAAKGSTTGTVIIDHNNDGTANPLPFSLRGSVYNNNPQTYSDTLTLSTIPRASTITVNDANIGSSTNIVINKASSNFTTTLKYRVVGEGSWREPAIVTKTSNQVYGWTVPTSLYSSIPNTKTIRCEFQATTYSGDTQIGNPTTTTATFTATGNPTIGTRTATDVNSITARLTSDSDTSTTKMVKYASNVQISVGATAQNSAYISSITVNGYNVTLDGTSTSTTRSGTITFNGATTNTFTIVATDSRGYITTSTTSNTLTMVEYVPLTINATISRNTPVDGNVNINYNGNYFNNTFGSQSNSLTVQYRSIEKGDSWENVQWINITPTITNNTYSGTEQLNGYDYTNQYEFQIRAIDEIQTKVIEGINVPKGKPIFNWEDSKFNVNGEYYQNNMPLSNYYLKNFKHVDNVDLNNLDTSGIYYCGTGLTNAPSSSYIYLFVMSAGGYDITQLAIKEDVVPVLYVRTRIIIQGVVQWSGWKKIISDEYLGSNPDINSLKNSSGIYGLYNCSQAPTLDIGMLEVLMYSNDWVIQRFTTVDSSPHMWERCFTNGTTWNNWIQRW